jgi:hypothetical protein
MLKTIGNLSTRSGNQTIDDGNLVIGTAGKGIDFSADGQSAGMTSELLNDYEVGTWTPTVEGSTSAGTGTYAGQLGRYTKIGNIVHFSAWINVSGHTGTGDMRITGLPFAAANLTAIRAAVPAGYFAGLTVPANSVPTGYVVNNTSYIQMSSMATAGSGTANLAMDAAFQLALSGTYQV